MHPFLSPSSDPAGGAEPAAEISTWAELITRLPAPAWIVDASGRLLAANPAWLELTESSIAQFPSALPTELVHPVDRTNLINLAMPDSAAPVQCDYRIARGGQGYARIRESISRLMDAAGQPVGFMGVATKIDDLVPHAESLTTSAASAVDYESRHRFEALGWLAAGVAHDFNNLLTAIRIYSDLLEEDLRETPHEGPVKEIIHASRSASFLVQNLETFGRASLARVEKLDLNEVLNGLTEFLRSVLGESISLETKTALMPARVELDRKQIEQVILNLCLNSRNAVSDLGVVKIEVEHTALGDGEVAELSAGSYVRIRVADNGKGIPPDILPRIFEPFFSTRSSRKGSGLGLATSQAILRKAGGEITVASTPGEGTTFDLWVPALPESADSYPAPPPIEEDTIEPLHVLLVEDDEFVRSVATLLIQTSGHTVTEFERPGDVLAWATAEALSEVSVLITDIVMPDMNGLELSHRLRELKPDLKALYMSGYIDDPVTEQAMVDPGNHFLPKPFTAEEFAAMLIKVAQQTPD